MKTVILFFMSVLSLSTHAQPNNNKETDPPALLRGIGITFQSFDGLNSRIANRPEYKQLKDFAATLQLGCMKVHNRFVSDVDIIAGSSMSGDQDRKSSTVRFLGLGIDLGYDLVPATRVLLTPLVGIGAQGYLARFYKDNSAVPFDLVLVSPDVQNAIRPVNFRNGFFTYRLGMALAAVSPKNSAYSIGIQLRYLGTFKDRAWRSSDNQELANAPKDGLSQFQISLFMTGMPRMMKLK